MPCSGTASTRIAIATRAEIDWYNPFCFGEREERVSHQILCISGREIAGQRPKELQLVALGMVSTPHGHCSHAAISDVPGPHTGAEPDAFRRQHGPLPGSDVDVLAPRSAQAFRSSTAYTTRPPIFRYVGPVPYVRCFSSVRPERPGNARLPVYAGSAGQSGHGIGHFRTPG